MGKENLINTILSKTGACTLKLSDSNYDERLAYVSMITSLAWADGSIDNREREIINTIAKAAGSDIESQVELIISETQRFNLVKYDKWVSDLKSEPLKIALMVDMFLTAFADTICMQSETIYMKYIAGKLQITDEVYNIIRKDVEEYLNKRNKGNPTMSYEQGVANERENKPETESESKLRNLVNNFIRSIVLA